MARRIGNTQTPSAAGLSDIVNLKQNRNYVKDGIYPTPDNDALGGVRFDGTSSYLARTPSTAGNRKTWTWSGWVKRSKLGVNQYVFGTSATTPIDGFYFDTSDRIYYRSYNGTIENVIVLTTQVFRDTTSPYHIVVAVDTTNSTSTDRIKIYVNGTRITDFTTGTYPTQDYELGVNNTAQQEIGVYANTISLYSGYMSQIHLIDGLALDPTYFGYTDRETGQWKPKQYTGNFGTNGFYLPMNDYNFGWNSDTTGNYSFTTIGGDTTSVYDSSYGDDVVTLDGSGDYILLPNDVDDILIEKRAFTVAGWVKFTSTGTLNSSVFKLLVNNYILIANLGVASAITARVSDGTTSLESSRYTYTVGEWFHFAFTGDGTTGDLIFYINGSEHSKAADGTWGGTFDNYTNSAYAYNIIGANSPTEYYNPIDIADYRIYDSALSPNDVQNLYLKEDIRDNLVAHYPMNNKFRSYGIDKHDSVPDSPQNTFATMNILASDGVFTEGNLKYVTTQDAASSTLGASSGLFYFEVYIDTSNNNYIGILDISQGQNPLRGGSWNQNGAIAYKADGTQYNVTIGGTGSVSSYGGTMSSGNIIGVAFDIDKDTLTFYKNGISQGNTTYGPSYISNDGIFGAFVYGGTSSSSGATFNLNFGQDHTFAGAKSALTTPYTDTNGIGEFYYPPPDGALALCTQNLESGLKNTTVEKKYYNRDETGKVLSYEGYNDYTYGTINDERFSDLSPYSDSSVKSFYFDGSGDYIVSDTSQDFAFGTGDFTVEGWVYPEVLVNMPFFSIGTYVTGLDARFNEGGSNRLGFYINNNVVEANFNRKNQWTHFAFVRENNNLRIYINGIKSNDYGTFTSTANLTDTVVEIGNLTAGATSGQNWFQGYLVDFNIIKGSAKYTADDESANIPTSKITADANTKLLLQPYNTETVNNTTPMYPREEIGKILDYKGGVDFINMSPYADNSVKSFDFNGTNAYIHLPTISAVGTNDYTVELWFREKVDVSEAYSGIINLYNSDTSMRFHLTINSGVLYLYVGTSAWISTGWQPTTGKWHHIAFVRDYSTTTGTVYVDGSSVYSSSSVGGVNYTSDWGGDYATIAYHNGYGYNNCQITDVRIVNGTAVYTGAFTPPSGKLTTTGGTYPSTTNVNTSITAGHTVFLAQPYSQPATIPDSGSQYRTNRIYQTDETGKTLIYG